MSTTTSVNPHHLRPMQVEVLDRRLLITPDRDFDRDGRLQDWSREIVRACAGPIERIEVDLGYRPMISSAFFAGALRLLDHYRPHGLQRIVLRRVSSRILRTIEMMRLRDTFEIVD